MQKLTIAAAASLGFVTPLLVTISRAALERALRNAAKESPSAALTEISSLTGTWARLGNER